MMPRPPRLPWCFSALVTLLFSQQLRPTRATRWDWPQAYPIVPPTYQTENETYYELHITLANGAPDCYERKVILVNGLYQPNLQVYINDTLKVGSRLT